MLPPAVVEQQAKLGVCAEESKAQRLKRQQARFRDRGGAFVPSNTNPLVNILLARTVSGESPSKARPKDVTAKRRSPSKPRRTSPTRKTGAVTTSDGSQAVAGSSKSKLPASQKRKKKVAVELQADTTTKPAPKRRGRPAKGKKKAPNADSDTEQPPPNTKSKSMSKGKDKQRNTSTAPSTSDGNPKRKPKAKAKAKSNPAKAVVEVLVSDDDRTLVEVPNKVKSNLKRSIRYEHDGETDDDAPIIRKRVLPPTDDLQASGTKTATRVKAEKIKIPGMGSSGKKMEDGETTVQSEKCPKTTAKKRLVQRGDDDADVTAPVAKKRKAINSTSAKPKNAVESLAPRTTKDVKNGENSKATGKGKGRAKAVEEDDDERPPERTSKPKKRKKEEDNYDDRPRKAVKFSDPVPPHSSSQKLKENQSDRKHNNVAKLSSKDELDAPRPKQATKPPSRARRSKGPPREVLERIKASAVRHLQCADSEPDELDCLAYV